jgi:tetratricopeptide (TPR) repeat protein
VFELKDLAEADRPRVDSANLKILGEVLSGRSVYGGGTANLTSAEWLSRWEAFRHSYPEYHDLAQFRTMSSDAVRAAKPADVPAGVPVDRYVVALGHLSAGQFNEAIAALDQHLASRPNHCCGYYHRGAAYLALGRYEEAVADLTKAIELKHKGSDVRYGRGVAYSQLGQFDKSLDDLNQVIQMTPGHSIAYQHRAGVYAELGQWEKAAADFAKTVELGRYEEVFASYALVRLQWKGMSEYRAFCRELLERLGQTKDADTANGIAWTCCLVPEAVADFRPCVRLAGLAVASEPKSRVYVNTLGAALYRAGDFQGAVEKMTEAVQLAGPEVSALDLFFLAMAHHRLKRQDQARQFLAKAVQWIDDHGGANSRPGPRAKGLRWTTRLEIQLLRKEAESLIGIP